MKFNGKYIGKDGAVCAGTLADSNLSEIFLGVGIRKYTARR